MILIRRNYLKVTPTKLRRTFGFFKINYEATAIPYVTYHFRCYITTVYYMTETRCSSITTRYMDVIVIYRNASDYDQDAGGFIPNLKITHRLVNEPCMRPRPKGKSMMFSFSRSWRSNPAYAGILPSILIVVTVV